MSASRRAVSSAGSPSRRSGSSSHSPTRGGSRNSRSRPARAGPVGLDPVVCDPAPKIEKGLLVRLRGDPAGAGRSRAGAARRRHAAGRRVRSAGSTATTSPTAHLNGFSSGCACFFAGSKTCASPEVVVLGGIPVAPDLFALSLVIDRPDAVRGGRSGRPRPRGPRASGPSGGGIPTTPTCPRDDASRAVEPAAMSPAASDSGRPDRSA